MWVVCVCRSLKRTLESRRDEDRLTTPHGPPLNACEACAAEAWMRFPTGGSRFCVGSDTARYLLINEQIPKLSGVRRLELSGAFFLYRHTSPRPRRGDRRYRDLPRKPGLVPGDVRTMVRELISRPTHSSVRALATSLWPPESRACCAQSSGGPADNGYFPPESARPALPG